MVALRRVEDGRQYLRLVSSPPWSAWIDGVAAYRAGTLNVVETVFLAHPMWLRDQSRHEQVYGKRSFGRSTVSHLARCGAAAVWDYGCELDEPIQFDHRFPYSFGGPTVRENRLSLCRVHNASKGGDVHLFEWERGVPEWLDPLLARMKAWT